MLLMVGLGNPQPPKCFRQLWQSPAGSQQQSSACSIPQHCLGSVILQEQQQQGVLRAASPSPSRQNPFPLTSCFEGFFLSCSFVYTRAVSRARVLLKIPLTNGTNASSVQQTPASIALLSWTWQKLMGQVIHPSK